MISSCPGSGLLHGVLSGVLWLAVALPLQAQAQAPSAPPPAIDACAQPALPLAQDLRIHHDATRKLTLPQAAALPVEQFLPLAEGMPRGFGVVWLRLLLRNPGDAPCRVWLSLNNPRLSDVRVHVQHANGWQSQRAGNAVPRDEWPAPYRHAVFPVELAAGEQVLLFVHIQAGRDLLMFNPILRTDRGQAQWQERMDFTDGMMLGIALLLAAVGLAAALILRSPVVLAMCVALFSSALYAGVLNGYALFASSAQPAFWMSVLWMSLVNFVALFVWLWLLFGIQRLSRGWNVALGLLLALFVASRLLIAFGIEWHLVFMRMVRVLSVAGLLAAFVATLAHRLRHDAMAWLVAMLLATQFILFFLLAADKVQPWEAGFSPVLHLLSSAIWQSGYSIQTQPSQAVGLALLTATIVRELLSSRRREHAARNDLETQRRTELERLEDTVMLRTGELRKALRARGALLARISHDLRSPLASIVDYARLLRDGRGENDFSGKIERNARHQMELIDELLEFAREDAEAVAIEPHAGYLHAFLREMEEEGQVFAQRNGNRFAASFAPNLPAVVRADFRRLRQVLFNLLGNAAKFTRNGAILLAVEQEGSDYDTAHLRFTVSDTGLGLAPHEHERVMQPFARGGNAGDAEGAGLGLSIVRQLLELMGAQLLIASAPGAGSHFSFTLALPLADENEVEAAYVESHETAMDGAGRRVLVVDDVELNREWLADLLNGHGFEAETAADGQAALDALATEHFDLLLTDQMMPGMDGWELLRQARARHPELPVLLYSSAPPRHPHAGLDGLRFDAELLKPATSSELLACIARLVES